MSAAQTGPIRPHNKRFGSRIDPSGLSSDPGRFRLWTVARTFREPVVIYIATICALLQCSKFG
jgi:hypothetical protein